MAIANQRSEEPSGACVQYKSKGNVGSDHVGVLEYGLQNDTHIQKVHPTQAVSQTPRLKASTYKSPILDPSVADAVKRPTSLLDDLPYMHASMIHD